MTKDWPVRSKEDSEEYTHSKYKEQLLPLGLAWWTGWHGYREAAAAELAENRPSSGLGKAAHAAVSLETLGRKTTRGGSARENC